MPKMITGVSLERSVVKKAKAIAKQKRWSFSNYVEWLLIRDQKPAVITSTPNHHKKKVTQLKRREKK